MNTIIEFLLGTIIGLSVVLIIVLGAIINTANAEPFNEARNTILPEASVTTYSTDQTYLANPPTFSDSNSSIPVGNGGYIQGSPGVGHDTYTAGSYFTSNNGTKTAVGVFDRMIPSNAYQVGK